VHAWQDISDFSQLLCADVQLQVFEAVMNKDLAEVQHVYRGDGMLNLSDPDQIFNTITSSVVEYDCFGVFLSVLQHLLVIPSADLAGKQQWEAAEEALHQIVTHSDDEYSLTYEVCVCMCLSYVCLCIHGISTVYSKPHIAGLVSVSVHVQTIHAQQLLFVVQQPSCNLNVLASLMNTLQQR
jgi:Diaphanous FH3 Domain